MIKDRPHKRLPTWFRMHISAGGTFARVHDLMRRQRLHTVCESAACPNQHECWSSGTAAFLILGTVCTRACGFCNIPSGRPAVPDLEEPERIASSVAALGLDYAVLTSVTRDDLPDGGAHAFAETLRAIHLRVPGCRAEVLVPDFQGSASSLATVLEASPHVLNHNVETVPRLYRQVRPQAEYARSLVLIERAAAHGASTKSGLMLGLGETRREVLSVLRDLRSAGCSSVTIGQYLQPNKRSLPVEAFYHPREFSEFRSEAMMMGFTSVSAGPLVRSSYHAAGTTASLLPGSEQTGNAISLPEAGQH